MKILTTKNQRGFTLIEIMVVFLIFIALFDYIWLLYKNSLNSSEVLTESMNVQGEVRNAFNSMVASLRSASPSATGSYTIAAASSTALTYYSDIDRDGSKEQIRYFLAGNALKQGITKASGNPPSYQSANEKTNNLIKNVVRDETKPIFSYYDGNYDGSGPALINPPDILDIRLIKITVTIDREPDAPPAPAEFSTQVSIRNLKDNL
jgi:type II secretory pathway pseudopilin PulG